MRIATLPGFRFPPRLAPTTLPLLYLGGPMRGYPDDNFPLFTSVALALRDEGFHVINPAETAGGEKTLTWHQFMEIDLSYIRTVDATIFLPGWRESEGAKTEAVVTHAYGKPIFEIAPWAEGTGSRYVVREVRLDMKATALEEL